jgi:hypothetical protein
MFDLLSPSAVPLADDLKIIFREMRDAAHTVPKNDDWYAEQLAEAVDRHLWRGLDGLGTSLSDSQDAAFAEHIRIYHAGDSSENQTGEPS